MAIIFKEIRQYLARNVRLSICFKDGHYDDYLICSDIPEGKYDDLYVYGVGKIDVEFSKDVYTAHQTNFAVKDIDLCPALEIVLWDRPRDDVPVRKMEDVLKFEDLRDYLQLTGNYSVVLQKNWSSKSYRGRNEIPYTYNEYFVYGIGLEEDPDQYRRLKNGWHDNSDTKRVVIVISEEPREDKNKHICGKGPFFLVVTADEWNHDDDKWLGIYVDKKAACKAYDRAVAWWDIERNALYSTAQRVAMFEYVTDDDRFREVDRKELE